MFQFDLDINPKIKVHFIGIGGVSMSVSPTYYMTEDLK